MARKAAIGKEWVSLYLRLVCGDARRIPVDSVYTFGHRWGSWRHGVPPFLMKDGFMSKGALGGHLRYGNPTVAMTALSREVKYFDLDIDRIPGQQSRLERLLEAFGPQAERLALLYRKPSGGLSLLGRLHGQGLMRSDMSGNDYDLAVLQGEMAAICEAVGVKVEIFPSATKPRRLPFQGGEQGHVLVDPEEYLNKWGPAIEDVHFITDEDGFWGALGASLLAGTSEVVLYPGVRQKELQHFFGLQPIDLPAVLRSVSKKVSTPPPAVMSAGSATTAPIKPPPKAVIAASPAVGPAPMGAPMATFSHPIKTPGLVHEAGDMTAERLWDVGLEAPATRNLAVMILAGDCQRAGLTENEAVEKIVGWFHSGKTNGFSKDFARDPRATLKRAVRTVWWAYRKGGATGPRKKKTPPMGLTLSELLWLVERLEAQGLNLSDSDDLKTFTWAYEFYKLVKPQLMSQFAKHPDVEFMVADVRISASALRRLKFGSEHRYLVHLAKIDPLVKRRLNYTPGSASEVGVPSKYAVQFRRSEDEAEPLLSVCRPLKHLLKKLLVKKKADSSS